MLQKIRDRLTGWVALAILGTIGVTFVFVGGANFAFTGNNYAAKVDGVEIGIGQFESAYRQQIQNNPQLVTLPPEYRLQMRTNILEGLIQQRVIDNYLDDSGYRASDTQIMDIIRQQPEFMVDGKFDSALYRQKLAEFNYVPAEFEEAQRLTLRRGQLQRAIRASSIITPADFRRYLNLLYEQRVVTMATISPDSVADEVSVTDEMITTYYDDNPAIFQLPESADVDYVEVSREAVAATVDVSEDDLLAYYEENKDRYLRDEQRQARHILILFDDDEDGAEVVANEVLTRIQAGESFEQLAAQYSKDGGTASDGGNLGVMTQTQMAGELGDAIFSMDQGEVRGPVRTDFGFHIVRLDEILIQGPLPFDQVRAALLTEMQEEEADGLFLAMERRLSDALFDAESIQDLAAAVGGDVQTVAGFTRSGGEPFVDSETAIDAIFDPAVLSGDQLSELVELDANRTVVFAVSNHYEASRQPLDDVREQISGALVNSQSESLMVARAQSMLDAMEAGTDMAVASAEVGATLTAPVAMTRNADNADQFVSVAVFTAAKPSADQPTFGSTRNGVGGQTVYRIDAVVPGRPQSIPLENRDAGRVELVDRYGVGDFVGFVQSLRADADVVINDDLLAADDLL